MKYIKSLMAALLLLTSLFSLPLQAAKEPGKILRKGLFNVSKAGSEWFFEIPDSLLGRRFLVTVRYTSTPAGVGKYGGEMANQQTVYWELGPNNSRLLLRSDCLVNTADSVDAINRAILVSNENPIIGSFELISRAGGMNKVKVDRFFQQDNPAIGLTNGNKRNFGLSAYMSDLSYIEDIKTFPMNTEVRTVKTWMATSGSPAAAYTGRVTLGLNVSFVLLPKEPMRRRYFDPRVGYFTDAYTYFSDGQQRVQPKRFITRWRLEPKDSADAEKMKRGELVEPKKQIVYYIDPATPKQWRPYLIQGVNDWQKAFEKAGFKNAIVGKEWPEKDSTMSMEDARYSVIRYLASDIPNAYGPQVHDPRSGEILESHIGWYHNVMTLVHDWYMIQAGTIDEAARKMKYDEELMGQLIRFVSSHEVGHTLGLRHNFGSSSLSPVDSLRSKTWVEKYGHTASIMDYARFNYVAQPEDSISRAGIFPRINDYDEWAIEWGYKPMFDAYDDDSDHWELEKLTVKRLAENPRLWFGDGETNSTNDPRCLTEDLGDDAVKAGDYGILNLKRIIKQLPAWTYESNDIYHSNIKGVFQQVNNQFLRYVNHVLRNIGGVYNDYKTVDQPGAFYSPVSLEKQKAALDFIDRHIFTEPTWLIAESYIHRLTPDPQKVTGRLATYIAGELFSAGFFARLNSEYPAADYLSDVTRLVFKELESGVRVTPYRRTLQLAAVNKLSAALASSSSAGSSSRHLVLATLRDLRRSLEAAAPADKETRAHYANLADLIARALDTK